MKRRDFLTGTAVGVGLAAAKTSFAVSPRKDEQEVLTAGQVLKELMDGNHRFVSGQSEHPHMTEDWLKRLIKGQKPMATILACSDSRVPLELLFDQGFGDLFTIRVAGNVVTRYGIGSMEYAQQHLRTPLFMVLGHEGCGAVTAAMLPEKKRAEEPKGVRELLDLIHLGQVDPKADAKSRVESAVEANVLNSFSQIKHVDAKTEGLQLRKSELLVAAVYELSTGRVRILDKYQDPR